MTKSISQTAAVAAQTGTAKTETYTERNERIYREMLTLRLTLEEFAARCQARYDERFPRRHSWRVQADEQMNGWIFDVHFDRDEPNPTEDEVIKIAYRRFSDIQARKGQINWHSVYVRDVEKIYVVAPKPGGNVYNDTATVEVVQDAVDRTWRWATHYNVNNSGCGSGVWFDGNQAESRESAVLQGAYSILEAVSQGWQYKEDSDTYKTFVNKLTATIQSIEDGIRQPSLFG